MIDPFIVAFTLLFIALATFDWYVAARFVKVALQRPYISVLTLAAVRSVAIAVSGSIFAVLGIASSVFLWAQIRILPAPWGTVLLVFGAAVTSLANLYALRVLRADDTANGAP